VSATAADRFPTAPAPTGRAANIALWVLQGLLAAFFLAAAAGPKLFGEATAVQMFDDIGLGQWFRYLVGALEAVFAVGLVIPRLARYAALGLAAVMAGAVLTSLFVLDAGLLSLTPAILLVLVGIVAWGRRPPSGSASRLGTE
jgi:putative oxidoreductase